MRGAERRACRSGGPHREDWPAFQPAFPYRTVTRERSVRVPWARSTATMALL